MNMPGVPGDRAPRREQKPIAAVAYLEMFMKRISLTILLAVVVWACLLLAPLAFGQDTLPPGTPPMLWSVGPDVTIGVTVEPLPPLPDPVIVTPEDVDSWWDDFADWLIETIGF